MTDTFASASSDPSGTSSETVQQGGDVTGTLADLERKLRELERELSSIGRRRSVDDAAPGAQSAPSSPQAPTSPRTFGATSDTPAQSSPAPTTAAAQPQFSPPPSGRLVDEAIELQGDAAPERVRPSEAQLASLAELRRFRDRLERFARELASEYDALLSRVMAGLSSSAASTPAPSEPRSSQVATPPPTPPPPPVTTSPPVATPSPIAAPAPIAAPSPIAAPAPTAAPSPIAAPAPVAASATSSPAPAAPALTAEESRENALFEGRVELGVGPFYDIASLGAFERRLASLPGVSEATVRRFEASHAVVDVRLATPVALVRELRRAADSDFSVREVASGRILLTFDET
jgi:hypothetical protein